MTPRSTAAKAAAAPQRPLPRPRRPSRAVRRPHSRRRWPSARPGQRLTKPGAKNIGEFVRHAEQWLMGGGAQVPEPDWSAIQARWPPPPGADSTLSLPDEAAKPLLSGLVLRELAAVADAFAAGSVAQPRRMNPAQQAVADASTPADAKLVLDNRTAQRIVGAPAWGRLLALLGRAQPDVVVLRKTEPAPGAAPGGIPFHTDAAQRTVQVPVTGDADIQGGRLVFVVDGRPVAARRAPGVPIVHGGAVVHGVTAHASGARVALYLLAYDEAVSGHSSSNSL